jgi:adenylate kinase
MAQRKSLQALQRFASAAFLNSAGSDVLRSAGRHLNTRTAAEALHPERIQWVFLGPPGVGKGTYSTRVAVALGVAHIAAGDLVRGEIKQRSPLGQQV